jgi:hypothetical protein
MYIAYIVICYKNPEYAQILKILQMAISVSSFFKLS